MYVREAVTALLQARIFRVNPQALNPKPAREAFQAVLHTAWQQALPRQPKGPGGGAPAEVMWRQLTLYRCRARSTCACTSSAPVVVGRACGSKGPCTSAALHKSSPQAGQSRCLRIPIMSGPAQRIQGCSAGAV